MPECNYEPRDAFFIREAEPLDAELLLSLERKLAEHEGALHKLEMTEAMLEAALRYGHCEGLVMSEISSGKIVGYALFYQNFAKFPGRAGMFLESLFVEPAFRASGAASILFEQLQSVAKQRNYARIDWIVLHDNEIAKRFYVKVGAAVRQDWNLWRIELEPGTPSEDELGLDSQDPEYKRRLSFITEKLKRQQADQQKIEQPMLRKYLLGFIDLDEAVRDTCREVESLARKILAQEVSLFQEYVDGKLVDQELSNFEAIYVTNNETSPGKYRFRAWCAQHELLGKYFPKYG